MLHLSMLHLHRNSYANVMKLLTSESILKKFIPNVISSVKGEVPLYDKLLPFLELAEVWVEGTFLSKGVLDFIAGCGDEEVVKVYATKVVVCEGYRNAIPSLDLILTPNGFGVVSNSNVAPASKERVYRLLESLETERDGAIRLLLSALPDVPGWCSTAQAEFFCSTLFSNLDICDFIGQGKRLWQKYCEVRQILLDIELHVVAHFIGQEQMDDFRKEALSPSSSSHIVKSVIRSLRAYEVQILKQRLNETAPSVLSPPTALVHIVNVIRNNPSEFPSWHRSDIAKLFEPPVFENKMEDTGYWF